MKKRLLYAAFATLFIFLLTACRDKEDVILTLKPQLNPSELTLTVGDKATVTLTGVPQDVEVFWITGADNIASPVNRTHDKTDVQAVGVGKTNIIAVVKSKGERLELKCSVTVKQNPNKQPIAFEDANLKRQLLAMQPSIDKDNDGEITPEEAKAVTDIDFHFDSKGDAIPDKVIKSVVGLEQFTNLRALNLKNQDITNAASIEKLASLETLNLCGNNITKLDVSLMTNLKDLRLYDTELTALDLSKNINLEQLYIQRTNISSLDISQLKKLQLLMANGAALTELTAVDLPALEQIQVTKNNIRKMTIRNLPALQQLHANSNVLKEITLENLPVLQRLNLYDNALESLTLDLPKLMFLFVYDNQLKQLDTSHLPMLFQISVSNNPIKKLDLSSNPIVRNIEAENMSAMTELNLKNNGDFDEDYEYLIIDGNTSLKTIYVDAGSEATAVKQLVGSKAINVVE